MGLKVLAAMSGGVDSATAAARAVDAGHEVTGVHLALSQNPQSYRTGARGCCTLEDARDARRAADVIGIPFYVWDLAERFKQDVVDDFVAEYAAGRTPNPCLRCNEKIKFEAVLDRALALGFDAVCTGHYARIDVDGRRAAARRRRRQGPVLRARRADQGPDRARDVPARRHAQGGGPRRGGRARPAGRRQARQPRRLLHRRRRHPGLPGPAARRRRRGRSWTRTAPCSARTRAPSGSRSASARACGLIAPPRTAIPATCCRSSRSATPSPSARPPRSR